MKCKNCVFCYEELDTPYTGRDDLTPYCVLQDLFTHVIPDAECGENCNNDEWVISHALERT